MNRSRISGETRAPRFRKMLIRLLRYTANSNLHCVYEVNSLAVRKSRNTFRPPRYTRCEKVKCVVLLRFHCCVTGRRKTGQGCIRDCSEKVPHVSSSQSRILRTYTPSYFIYRFYYIFLHMYYH